MSDIWNKAKDLAADAAEAVTGAAKSTAQAADELKGKVEDAASKAWEATKEKAAAVGESATAAAHETATAASGLAQKTALRVNANFDRRQAEARGGA